MSDEPVDDTVAEDAAYYHSKILRTALTLFMQDGAVDLQEKACARRLRGRLDMRVEEFGGSTWRGDVFGDPRLRAEVAALRALAQYAKHSGNCASLNGRCAAHDTPRKRADACPPYACDCGLAAAQAKVAAGGQ